MLEEIDASRAEAEMRSGENPLPELDPSTTRKKVTGGRSLSDGTDTVSKAQASLFSID
jgi:transposase